MKASKFNCAQEAAAIKQGGEAAPVAEVCRKAGSAKPWFQLGGSIRKAATIGDARRCLQV